MDEEDKGKPDEQAAPEKKTHPIAHDIKSYVKTIDSLKESLSMSMRVIQTVHKEYVKRYNQFVDKNCVAEGEGDKGSRNIPIEHYTRFTALASRVEKTSIAFDVVPRSFLVALVSEYDAFLGKLLASIFRLQPEMLKASERTLSFSQLSEFSSIEDARDYVLEKEVENFLRQSHSDQFKSLEERFKLPLRKDLQAWAPFIEVTERRNLFVHAGGAVSRQYIQNCREHGVVHETPVEAGLQLSVPWKYFVHAHAVLLEIGVKLAQVLWRKVQPTEIGEADKSLSNLTYGLLSEKSYSLAKTLLDFALLTLKKHESEHSRLVFLVNRAQAYKWGGEPQVALKIMEDTDWSATSSTFRLAHAVLTDNFHLAASLMEQIGPNGNPHKVEYRDWPLFRDFRKSPEFKDTYEKVFGEAFFESDEAGTLDPAPEQKPSDMPNSGDANGPLIQ